MILFSAFPFYVLLVALASVRADITGGDGKNCSCGFYDALTKELFTDSIIVYFNETTGLPLDDFVVQSYTNAYEKSWNSRYRQGADAANIKVNTSDSSLELYVSPPDSHHLVVGGGMRTSRRDIHYGSFRLLMQSPAQKVGGSALSMVFQYNDTQVTELSVMNADKPKDAWVGTFIHAEFPTRDLGVNYTVLMDNAAANRNYSVLGNSTLANGSVNPWDYTEYRVDWTKDETNFYIGGNCTRSVLHKDDESLLSVPAPVYFKHWSTGNDYSMDGPPTQLSVAKIAWIRMFFNSSLMTEDQHTEFAARCPVTDACSTDDITIRGSSSYPQEATNQWKQTDPRQVKRMPALWISVICIAMSSLLLLHAFIRRAPWRKSKAPSGHGHCPVRQTSEHALPEMVDSEEATLASGLPSPNLKSAHDFRKRMDDDLIIERADVTPGTSIYGGESSRAGSFRWDSRGTTPNANTPYSSNFNTSVEKFPITKSFQDRIAQEQEKSGFVSEETIRVQAEDPDSKKPTATVGASEVPAPKAAPAPRTRIDYLAGLVAICATLVTIMHFGLTFVPAIVIPGAPIHHRSEFWVQKIVSPFILNQMWLGVFFTTSTRFLVAKYLKDGNLKNIAHGAIRRTPRLMIPITAVVLFEYFLINCGVTKYLEYLPSITWSTWPFVTQFSTFGHFISEVLELIFIIPNAVPQITFNYCTGVLWTIAVQLQGSWLVLLGAVVVREIRTPWKRFGYYAFCVLNHWYAQSWGSYLWFGLMLADLDITYKYRPWLYARPAAYYPLIIFCWGCVAAGFAANIAPNWTDYNFATYENNIHPDTQSGLPLGSTDNGGYPAYYVPRLNGLLFAVGMQAIVEVSPAVQWFLSNRVLILVFPHIFTIYLLHGLVFWSWGSWLCVFLASRGFSYGINVIIVGFTSYGVLIMSLPIVTPIIEALGKDITTLVWEAASSKSPPRRPTLFPFPEDLFFEEAHPPPTASDVESNPSNWSEKNGSADSIYKSSGENKSSSRFSM